MRIFKNWADKKRQKEFNETYNIIKGFGKEERKYVLQSSIKIFNKMSSIEEGISERIFDDTFTFNNNSYIDGVKVTQYALYQIRKDFQKIGDLTNAGNILLWILSIRGILHPQDRSNTRKLWNILLKDNECLIKDLPIGIDSWFLN